MSNLILISLDTLRADRLGLLGYPKPTSPYLNHVASQGVSFSQAVSVKLFPPSPMLEKDPQ